MTSIVENSGLPRHAAELPSHVYIAGQLGSWAASPIPMREDSGTLREIREGHGNDRSIGGDISLRHVEGYARRS